MKLYYASLTDHKGTVVQDTKVYPSSRQAAAVAQSIISSVGPAQGFLIRHRIVDAREIAQLLNQHEPRLKTAWP
jgi:hypothetical protein